MRNEIGSEFWDVPLTEKNNKMFPESVQWYLSGRSALQAIIKELRNTRSVAMPSLCCDSMIKPFYDAGYEIQFYPVINSKEGLIQEVNTECDVLFLMDYFGYSGGQPDLADYKGIVIRDLTHSFFSDIYKDADYYFGSLRKWCGIWTGGYVWTLDGHKIVTGDEADQNYIKLRRQAMKEKSEYIHDCREDKGYLKLFDAAEESLENAGIMMAAERDVVLAQKIDVEEIRSKRRKNAEILIEAFPEWLIFPKLSAKDTPMFVPILVPDGKRDDLRRYLIKKSIYCPVHWPVSVYHRLNKDSEAIYMNELSLVCDQRYTEDDMHRMIENVKAFWKEF